MRQENPCGEKSKGGRGRALRQGTDILLGPYSECCRGHATRQQVSFSYTRFCGLPSSFPSYFEMRRRPHAGKGTHDWTEKQCFRSYLVCYEEQRLTRTEKQQFRSKGAVTRPRIKFLDRREKSHLSVLRYLFDRSHFQRSSGFTVAYSPD